MLEKKFVKDEKGDDIAPFDGTLLQYYTLKKFLEREDQYLNVARSPFTNWFIRVTYLHRAASNQNNEILPIFLY